MTDDHDRGLAHDLTTLADFARRRAFLKWGLALGAMPLIGCASENAGSSDSSSAAGATGAAGDATVPNPGSCSTIPEETSGPYPGDGTNGQNALTLTGIVRSDIRSSIAGASGVAEGVALTVTLTVLDSQNGCQPLAGHAVYLWHCDRQGNYSMYAAAVANENYLRGVQETDDSGQVTFTTIFPACYSGRWPHIHFEVYPSLAAAATGRNASATSQLALPKDACDDAFAQSGYTASVSNFKNMSLATDMVFADGAELETPVLTGSAAQGFAATLNVTV